MCYTFFYKEPVYQKLVLGKWRNFGTTKKTSVEKKTLFFFLEILVISFIIFKISQSNLDAYKFVSLLCSILQVP